MRAPARELFRDPAFPASDSSLFSSFSTPLAQFREDITWRRPQEICATPRLFPDNPQEGQVKQGLLGDCWFLCACAALQKSRHLLDQVFLPGQPTWLDQTYRGSFTCRVWQFGRWVEVTIDDRLPCLAGRLCFSRCQREDVFWLPLLEKVYAKVHGSYEHLWAGQVADALVDLTGGLAERWNLKNLASSRSQQDGSGGSEPKTCWQLLSLKERCLISCSVFSPKVPGSWGSFTPSSSRTCVSSGVRLVRVSCCFAFRTPGAGVAGRGPGERGVKGGPRWTQWTRRSCCPSSRKGSSGWMRRSFSVNLTRSPLATRSQRLATCRASTQRPRMRTVDWAGRAQAPVGDSRVVWSPASILGKDYPAVGLHLWKVEKRRVSLPRILSTPPVAGTVCHAYDREVHLRCELTPGYYLAVPSTFLKNVPGQFLLRVFSSGRVSLSAIKTVVQSTGPGETLLAGEWETVQLQGSWKIGQTAGGSRNFASYSSNPCFPLTIPEGAGPRCVRITLHQHCLDSDCHPIGFHVFQNGCEPRGVQKGVLPVPADNGGQGTPSLLLQKPLLSCVPHCYTQEVSRVCHLSAGTYRIVPSTYLPDTEGAFTVTIATRIDRRSIHSQEMLGQLLQEVHGAREGLPGVLGHEVHCVFPAVQGSHCPHLTISPFTGLLHGSDEDLTG
ncbi:calpain-10 isoform X8 [Myotis lucifugus]|uniref:calpain-10 isoform X8 n=1 Tax=Myotis lucifugus TaxID=59463 RepID=UPI000CCC4BED|nr:calpain-10 isoform X8 [Myotis lucifugus]